MTKRIHIIDSLRGLAIVLMLLQHIPLFIVEKLNIDSYSIAVILSRFSAPLFFILAGYCTYLSFNKNGPMRIIKRAIEIFLYGLLTNVFRHQALLTINVLISISAFIIICTVILYIKSKYAYYILLIGLLSYSFMVPEIVHGGVIHNTLDIFKIGEYPIAAWLIYSIIGLGLAWLDISKLKTLLIPFSVISIIYGFLTFALGYYKLSFIENTPPFLFMILGFIVIIYISLRTIKSTVLETFGKNSLFLYVSHLFLFSYVPVILGIGKPLGITGAIITYIITLIIAYYLLKEE